MDEDSCPISWPRWPQYSPATEAQIKQVFLNGRWAISGRWTGVKPKEQEFAEKFAAWNGVRFCVPVDHGTSSLVVALEAMDIGAGDEVIVPALTWVATATAVLTVNAAPVFVDVERSTCCISPEAIEKAITSRTKAIIVVHLHCVMADMDRIMALARSKGLYVIEDCAQAHGASWRGQRAGSIGDLGCFSMQQSKVLTCGEGGAVVTNAESIYRRLQQLRADGRLYSQVPPVLGDMHLCETADVMGTNYGLSEFQAAILIEQLEHLDEQNMVREENAAYLNQSLAQLHHVKPLRRPDQMDRQSVYEYAVRYSAGSPSPPTSEVCDGLTQATGFLVYQTDLPLPQNPLYCPWTKRRFSHITHPHAQKEVRNLCFPESKAAHDELIVFHHAILLATRRQMDAIVDAFQRVTP